MRMSMRMMGKMGWTGSRTFEDENEDEED